MSAVMKEQKIKHLPAEAHGEIKQLFNNIWFVKGAVKMPMLMPMRMTRSMTILRDAETGELTVINSMRLTESGFAELDKLGKVANVIRIAGFHGRDDGYYRERYGAKIYAIEGQAYVRKFDGVEKKEVEYMQPDVWLNKTSQLPVKSASLKIFETSNPPEAILVLEQEGGILIVGDSLQNMPSPDEFFNFPAKLMMGKMGFFKPCSVGPGWLQFGRPNKAEVRSIMDLNFEHVLPAHGDAVIGNARAKYRPVLEGDLAGCRA